MGRRKWNETEADDEEGKRLMYSIPLMLICSHFANLHVTHQRTTRSLHRVEPFHLRSCRVTCRLQNNIRRLLPFVDVR